MRKSLVALIVALALLLPMAAPASANEYGALCQNHYHLNATVRMCAIVNQHDFNKWKEGLGRGTRLTGSGPIRIYVDYLRLDRSLNGGPITIVEVNNPDQWYSFSGGSWEQSTDWFHGCAAVEEYWTEIRYKVEFNDGYRTGWGYISSFGISGMFC